MLQRIILVAVALVALVALNYFDPVAVERRRDDAAHRAYLQSLEREKERLELEQERQQAQLAMQTAPMVHYALTVGALVGLLAGALGAGAFGYAYARRQLATSRPDKRGLIPYRADDPATLDLAMLALAGHWQAQLAAAGRGGTPASLNYSPHYAITAPRAPGR